MVDLQSQVVAAKESRPRREAAKVSSPVVAAKEFRPRREEAVVYIVVTFKESVDFRERSVTWHHAL